MDKNKDKSNIGYYAFLLSLMQLTILFAIVFSIVNYMNMHHTMTVVYIKSVGLTTIAVIANDLFKSLLERRNLGVYAVGLGSCSLLAMNLDFGYLSYFTQIELVGLMLTPTVLYLCYKTR